MKTEAWQSQQWPASVRRWTGTHLPCRLVRGTPACHSASSTGRSSSLETEGAPRPGTLCFQTREVQDTWDARVILVQSQARREALKYREFHRTDTQSRTHTGRGPRGTPALPLLQAACGHCLSSAPGQCPRSACRAPGDPRPGCCARPQKGQRAAELERAASCRQEDPRERRREATRHTCPTRWATHRSSGRGLAGT